VKPLLALFDVDGTLFLTHDPLSSEALLETLREVYPADPADDAVERVDHAGQTAKRNARLVLRAEGLDDRAIDAQLDAWCGCFAERYVELLAGADTSGWEATPGASEALERLAAAGIRLALLTGNPETMARARMERLGLERFFPPGQGAFGCDAESRVDLIDLARARAGGWPADATVELGDTRRDEESARAAGIRAIHVDARRFEAVADRLLDWAES
jgi:phosphoglycolate phosphatase-like HAD superfamily hydrolase